MEIEFKQSQLANGLNIVAEINPAAHSTAMGFFVNTGARDEASRMMGVSHFLEHMMFKGTDTLNAEEVDQAFDDLGAIHNAFTTSEMTAFWAHCLPDHREQVFATLADILRPALRPDDLEDERKVIIEEIAMYEDNPFWVLYERGIESYYGNHTLSHRVLGTKETVSNISPQDMKQYFDERYAADNTVLAVAGCLDFDEVVAQANALCDHWPTSGTTRLYQPVVPQSDDFTMRLPTLAQAYVALIAPFPGANDDDRYAAALLSHILGGADGSRLHWALIETGLSEDAAAYFDPRDRTGEFLAYAACQPDQLEQVESLLRSEIDGLITSLTESDLERARAVFATASTLSEELSSGRMRRLGRLWTYSGEYRSLEDELKRISSVTLDNLKEVATRYPMEPVVSARLIPEHK
ncbi:MAG: pitrilysin family protein [Phycisphaerales bacterium]|nr:pitrilysin family protein [Phycisphaerales bacterium]